MKARDMAFRVVLVALLLGCGGGGPTDQLIGTWTLDADAMEKSDMFQSAADEQKQMIQMMLSSGKMEITFTKSKVKIEAEMMGQEKNEEHDYTVKSTEGNTLVLNSMENGKQADITVVVEQDSLTFKDEDGMAFVLKRK